MPAEPLFAEENARDVVRWIWRWCSSPSLKVRIPGADRFLFTTSEYTRINRSRRSGNTVAAQVRLDVYDVEKQQHLNPLRLMLTHDSTEITVQSGSSLLPPNPNPFMRPGIARHLLDSIVFDITSFVGAGSATSYVAVVLNALAKHATVGEATQVLTSTYQGSELSIWHRALRETGKLGV